MKKQLHYSVELLDGKSFVGNVDRGLPGRTLLDNVYKFAKIVEKDIFGLTYFVDDNKFWLKADKPVSKQIKGDYVLFNLAVKYYVPNPLAIKDNVARYYLFLQLRSDITLNRLPCSFVTLALLGSYSVQAQVGDHQEEVHGPGVGYLRPMRFCQSPNDEMLEKIAELHKTHRGMSSAEAEENFLTNVRHLSLYGVHMHPVKDMLGVEMSVGVYYAGILVYLDRLRVNRFTWARILELSRDDDRFIVHLRGSESEPKNRKVVYKLETSRQAKQLWQLAVDHHLFFRIMENYVENNEQFQPFTIGRSHARSFDRLSLTFRTPTYDRPGAISVRSDRGPRQTERSEKVVEEGPEFHRTIDVVGRDRSSVRSWSPDRTECPDEGCFYHWPRQTLSQGPPYDAPDRAWSQGPPYHDDEYEPCGNYLGQQARCIAYRESSSHSNYKGFYQGREQPHTGFSYCQHGDISEHESPKMIDQCHHTCSCDKILEERDFMIRREYRNGGETKLLSHPGGDRSPVTEVHASGSVNRYVEGSWMCPHGCINGRNEEEDEGEEEEELDKVIRTVTGVDNTLRVEKIEINTGAIFC